MTQLFQYRWESQEGEIFQRNGQGRLTDKYTHGFTLWANKTKDLTDLEWRKGFELVEKDVEEHKSMGKSGALFPPTYAEFIGLCRYQTFSTHGFLEPDDAYRHASIEIGKHSSDRKWNDELVYQTAVEVGFFEIRNSTEAKIYGRFKKTYLSLFKRYLSGERFAIPENRQIELQESEPLSKEENHSRMQKLKAEMGWGSAV